MTSIHVRRLQNRIDRTAARFLDLADNAAVRLADLPAAKLPWYEIRDQAGQADEDDAGDGDGAATVFIFDEIGGSFGVSAKAFATDLEAITAPRISVRINSPGGSVFDAIAIHSALLHHPARVRSYVDGVAASAASVIAMAADALVEADDSGGIIMMPGAEMMIHDASTVVDGNQAELEKLAVWIGRQSENVADLYRQRAGGTADEWRQLMLAETWMFGDEAVEMGLADRVHERPQPAADAELDERMRRTFDLGGYRYAGRPAAPAPAARRHATTRPGTARHSGGSTPAMTITVRQSPEALRADAARRRAAGAEQAGYRPRPGARGQTRGVRTPPAGLARSLDFPARLTAKLETRRGQELYHLHGMASMYGRRYEMWDEFGPYWEKVNERAGDATLAADPDVAFLVNHRGVTMARTRNDTLELQSNTGLETDAWLNPKRQDVTDFVIAVEDGNVTEMSFAFMLDDGVWNQDFTEFEIMQYDLNRGDVSGVNYGANPYTSIAARQRELLGELDRMTPGLGRAALDRLLQRQDLNLDALYEVAAADHDKAVTRSGPPAVASVSVPAGRSIAHIEAMLLDE